MSTRNIAHRITVYLLLSVAVSVFIAHIVSYGYLRSYSPRAPDTLTGQVYARRMQLGYEVYLTGLQRDWLKYAPITWALSGFVAGYLNLRWKVFRNLQEELPKKFY
jgi:hypothetical protein